MRLLKICMVTTFYPPYNFGGDGFFVHRLTNVLARQGHEVHVVHDLDAFALLTDHRPIPSLPSHPNVVLHPLSARGIGSLDQLLTHQLGRPLIKRAEIKHVLEEEGFDVIHFHNVSLLGGPHVLAYGSAIKLCTMHDYWFVCAMHVLWRFDREICAKRTCLACTLAGRRPPQLWRYDGSLPRAARHVDAFITPSRASRDIHLANGFPAAIRHIPYFMPDAEVESLMDEDPGAYHHASGRPYFLFVGRLEKIKGLQALLDVFRNYREADLVIAGTGTYMATLRELGRGLPHVHFLGLLDHGQLRGLYSQAVAVIVPSVCFESFGWITLEAFVMRAPVIVRNQGALPEVVGAGGGLIYGTNDELVNHMEALRTQPELRRTLGEQGYQSYLDHFAEARHLEKYYGLIEELETGRLDAQPESR